MLNFYSQWSDFEDVYICGGAHDEHNGEHGAHNGAHNGAHGAQYIQQIDARARTNPICLSMNRICLHDFKQKVEKF